MPLHEGQSLAVTLCSQPLVAVDIDLERERQPGLEADVHEAKTRIEEIVVEHALLPWPRDKARTFFAARELKGVAGFLGAQDPDESLGNAVLADEFLGPFLLAELAGAIQEDAPGFASESFPVLDKFLGVLGSELLHEILAADFQDIVHKPFEFPGRGQPQMPFVDGAIAAFQLPDKEAGQLDHKGRYGV